jgi:glycosyltransferase involved in cell wall biosynthesis
MGGAVNILLLTSHSIAEYDDLRMFTDAGYDVFSIGAYTDPLHPADDMRPPIAHERANWPDLAALCHAQRVKHAEDDPGYVIDWAKGDLHPEVIAWADVIVVHHFLDPWVIDQWHRIRHKRVVWRTCGQSDPRLERAMAPLHADGLTIVRYSPAEQRFFEGIGVWAGQDALIRFGKYIDDYTGWRGDGAWVGNVTQDMLGRGEACGLTFWRESVRDLDARPAGPRSEGLEGGVGKLSPDELHEYLRACRAYLYTGTQPASYTLGLMEAMLTGTPVVSIGKGRMVAPALFEADELVPRAYDSPWDARRYLRGLLADPDEALFQSVVARQVGQALFSVTSVLPQWVELLGAP